MDRALLVEHRLRVNDIVRLPSGREAAIVRTTCSLRLELRYLAPEPDEFPFVALRPGLVRFVRRPTAAPPTRLLRSLVRPGLDQIAALAA